VKKKKKSHSALLLGYDCAGKSNVDANKCALVHTMFNHDYDSLHRFSK
jgi:hypothetical protein